MPTLDVEFSADRPDGSVWVRRVDEGGPWDAAGGRVGDLACSFDGVTLAEWAQRPRVAGEVVAVEIERLGEKLTIYPVWREVAHREAEVSAGESDAVTAILQDVAVEASGATSNTSFAAADCVFRPERSTGLKAGTSLPRDVPIFANLPALEEERRRNKPRRGRYTYDYNPYADDR